MEGLPSGAFGCLALHQTAHMGQTVNHCTREQTRPRSPRSAVRMSLGRKMFELESQVNYCELCDSVQHSESGEFGRCHHGNGTERSATVTCACKGMPVPELPAAALGQCMMAVVSYIAAVTAVPHLDTSKSSTPSKVTKSWVMASFITFFSVPDSVSVFPSALVLPSCLFSGFCFLVYYLLFFGSKLLVRMSSLTSCALC